MITVDPDERFKVRCNAIYARGLAPSSERPKKGIWRALAAGALDGEVRSGDIRLGILQVRLVSRYRRAGWNR